MIKIKESIKSLYAINLVEGEGIGTAYEYYAKLRKLIKFINSIERPRRILIAGLPEKYGLSMDFFLLAQILKAETLAIDDRSSRLERARKVFSKLKSKRIFDDINVIFSRVDNIVEFDKGSLRDGKFDLALSSEVLQRLDGAQSKYISTLVGQAKHFAIFVPNRGNKSHANITGLKSVYLSELLKCCREEHSGVSIYDFGYIDMPPFPPGLTRSHEKRELASKSRVEAFLMKGLEIYSLCEDIIPKFVKEKIAHITYFMAKNG